MPARPRSRTTSTPYCAWPATPNYHLYRSSNAPRQLPRPAAKSISASAIEPADLQRSPETLLISVDTLKSHMKNVYVKLHVNSRAGAVRARPMSRSAQADAELMRDTIVAADR